MEKEVREQYLKTIESLEEPDRPTKTKDIAKALNLAPASVTESLQKLAREGYLEYEPYHGASLTDKGRALAKKVSRKHRLLERFLADILRIEPSKVHKEACALEHSLSDEAEVALCRMLNHPDKCPDDGKVIPPCDLDVENCLECKKIELDKRKSWDDHSGLRPLTQLRPGESGRIHFIRGGRARLERLNNIGLTKNTEVEVLRSAPLRGPIEICVRGCKLCIGREIASNIFVET
ncbi:MAG: metal-dependent transcriptional regulator [Thermoplasmata archaeon]